MLKRIRALFSKKGARAEDSAPPPPRPPVHVGPKVVHQPIPASDLDPDAVKIVRRLTRFDHTAYLVGGCVRDLLLDRKPKDFDIATSATPRQIKRVFRNSRIIGRRFRLAHIYFQNNKIIEVATFRANDGDESGNGGDDDLLIRDDNVFGTPEDDALRRDFTINCLFYDVNDECVIDHADGLGDLKRRFIRTIGDPDIRFREDPIRILRAVKFAARLNFRIETDTLRSIRDNAGQIPKAAAPRILEELNRFCRHGAARASFELLRETGVFDTVLPEFVDGYRDHAEAWKLMLHLFDHLDRHTLEGHEATTGEILAVLSLPLLAEEFGWSPDGKALQPRGLHVRERVDDRMRPLSQRLRTARKDQERCRQILQSLYRMVPVKRMRRGAKRSILRRECLPDAVWILHALAEHWGGDFAEASEYWLAAVRQEPAAAPRQEADRREAGAGGREERGSGRGRRRRRGRGRKRTEPAAEAPAPKRDDLPPVWDDRYFFAALPSVPKMEPEADGRGSDRYGANALAAKVEDDPEEPAEAKTAEAKGAEAKVAGARRGGRRRRRGGRGRGRRGKRSGTGETPSGDDST